MRIAPFGHLGPLNGWPELHPFRPNRHASQIKIKALQLLVSVHLLHMQPGKIDRTARNAVHIELELMRNFHTKDNRHFTAKCKQIMQHLPLTLAFRQAVVLDLGLDGRNEERKKNAHSHAS